MKGWIPVLLALFSPIIKGQQNGIVGDPQVHCGSKHIEMTFDTYTPFTGIVFVREKLEEPECRSPPADDNGQRNTSIKIGLTSCGTERKLSMDPDGIFITTNIIVAFNENFLTKHDRVYQVQCYYMAMDMAEMRGININMPGPAMQTAIVPMPVCRYEVLDKTPFGPSVYYAHVGQMVYHKWTCETDTTDTFCMVVHSCTVDDGDGNKVELLDEKGCAHDKYLLQNLEYTGDLMAGKEAHVYKYADKQGVFFECQISLTVKEPGQTLCQVPECPDPPRRRRSHIVNDSTEIVQYPTITNELNAAFVLREQEVHYEPSSDEVNSICFDETMVAVYIGSNGAALILALLLSLPHLLSI